MQATPTIAAANARAHSWGRRLAALREKHYGWVVFALLVAASLVRLGVLREFWAENPFAAYPILDAELYWERAGEMAAGRWFTGEPFHIAPLYPYLLGVFRWCGGGTVALGLIQTTLHLGTAVLVGEATRSRFGNVSGWVSVALFLGLAEPALFATRILGTTLQMFLAALLWWDWARLTDATTPRPGALVRVACWIGLLSLAYPGALLLVPVYAAWLVSGGGSARQRLARAAAATAVALAVIGSATLHNALAAGEFIPVTSHSGITLSAGNGPGSVGIFTPLTDTENGVRDQARESAAAFERATGREGTWREIDSFYRDRIVRWWLENPAESALLFARKAYWYLTSLHYDNVTAFGLEREYGLHDAGAWLPVETPWIMGVAIVGALLTFARPRRFAPELSLSLLPLVVCVVFMYSARYRAVAIPVLCGLAGFATVGWRAIPWPRPAVALLALLPVPLLIANALSGFGSVDFMREDFADLLVDTHVRAARARLDAGDFTAAEGHLRRAADADTGNSSPLRELAALHLERGEIAAARAAALGAVRRDSNDVKAHHLLYDAQIHAEDYRSAMISLHLVEELTREDPGVQVALAWFYAACPDVRLRDARRAGIHARAAARLAGSDDPDVLIVGALAAVAHGDFDAAEHAVTRGLELARERNDDSLQVHLEELATHIGDRRTFSSRPRLFDVR